MIVRGAGSIGRRHLHVLTSELGLEAIAAPVRAERVASMLAEGMHVVTGDSIASPHPSLVVVATDTARHLSDAEEAIAAGAHVLIEKPLAPTAAGAAHLERLAAQADALAGAANTPHAFAGKTIPLNPAEEREVITPSEMS